MGLFDIDFEKFGLTLVPPYMRRAVTIAYTKSGLNPLIDSKQTYLTAFRAKAKDDAIRNAQKIMLEDRLNLDFNTSGIYIETFVANLETNYFYGLDEVTPPPVYFYHIGALLSLTIYMYAAIDYVPTNNFTVFVPAADVIADPELEAKVTDNVNKYKVVGTTFNIEQY